MKEEVWEKLRNGRTDGQEDGEEAYSSLQFH